MSHGSPSFHDVRSVRVAATHEGNSRCLTLRIEHIEHGVTASGDYAEFIARHEVSLFFGNSAAEYDILLAALPKADDFVAHKD